MQPFNTVSGRAAPLLQANLDTDVIIRIERLTAGDPGSLGLYAFEALRYRPDGTENPDFVLNRAGYRGAPILIAGPNFGCGSSREGAVTALLALGIRCVVADSFGDIFYGNCFQNGVLPVRLAAPEVTALAAEAPDGAFTIDLRAGSITAPSGRRVAFEIDALRRSALLEGLDDIGLTLKHSAAITAWQQADRTTRPWVWQVAAVAWGENR
ncbi:MAG: 3-isopropylmalate dehydratase small subunit [Aliidongia sp.]